MQKMRLLLLSLFFTSSFAFASSDFWYWFHGNDIDYFSEGRKVKDPLKPTPPQQMTNAIAGRMPVREYDKRPFNWADYDDPASPVFFDDGGDYTMPRPLQFLIANPTKENAAKYKAWQNKKIETSMMIAKLLSSDVDDKLDENWKKVGLYYFYSSTCSACRAQSPVISELEKRGVKVTPVQVDYQSAPALYPNSLNYDEHMKRGFSITATPSFAIFGNGKSENWQGYTTLSDFKNKVVAMFSVKPI